MPVSCILQDEAGSEGIGAHHPQGAGIDVVWSEFLAVALIGGVSFSLTILRFPSVAAQRK